MRNFWFCALHWPSSSIIVHSRQVICTTQLLVHVSRTTLCTVDDLLIRTESSSVGVSCKVLVGLIPHRQWTSNYAVTLCTALLLQRLLRRNLEGRKWTQSWLESFRREMKQTVNSFGLAQHRVKWTSEMSNCRTFLEHTKTYLCTTDIQCHGQ
jgi:hypothetical protein